MKFSHLAAPLLNDMAVFAEILLRLMLSVAFKAAYGVAIMRRIVIVLLIDVGGKLNGR